METYYQEVKAGQCLDFEIIDNTTSLFIKHISIIPTPQENGNIIVYILKDNEKKILCRVNEKLTPNVNCLYTVIDHGKVVNKLHFEGVGSVSVIGYSIVDENYSEMEIE